MKLQSMLMDFYKFKIKLTLLTTIFLQELNVIIFLHSFIIAHLNTASLKNKNLISLKATTNCWICEGWTEFKFSYQPKEEIDVLTTPIMLHASCDNYAGELLQRDESQPGQVY